MNADPNNLKGDHTLKEKLQGLVDTTKLYVENKLELTMLKGSSKVSKTLATITVMAIAFVFTCLIITFAFIGLAILINQNMGSPYAGYFIMSGVLILLLVLTVTLGKTLIKTSIINIILKNIDDDE